MTESTAPHPQPAASRRLLSLRVIMILLVLLAAICACVIAADRLSPRDRRAGMPAPAPAPMGQGVPR